MEYLFKFILELFIEGSIEASQSPKIPKPLRFSTFYCNTIFHSNYYLRNIHVYNVNFRIF